MTALTEYRVALRAAGFNPVPVRGKAPTLQQWQTAQQVTPAEIARWERDYPTGRSTGVLCATTPTLDIDIRHQEAADEAEQVTREWFDGRGALPCRFGNAPKRALMFRTTVPFQKLKVHFIAPDDIRHSIEFLCSGQQVVVAGVHPDTGKPYSWHGSYGPGAIKHADLIEIDEAEAAELLEFLAAMLAERFNFRRVEGSSGAVNGHAKNTAGLDGPSDLAGLAEINWRDGQAVNDAYCKVIPRLLLNAEHPDDVLSDVTNIAMAGAERCGLQWDRRSEEKRIAGTILSQYRNLDLLLKGYDPRSGEIPTWLPAAFIDPWEAVLHKGRRPIIHRNRGGGFHIQSLAIKAEDDGGGASRTRGDPPPAGAPAKPAVLRRTFALHAFVPFDLAALPPRQWLYGRHYQRRCVSATIAPGGFGKTTLCMVEAVCMATCRDLLGEQPTERLRVWYHNGEDNLEELNRRLGAICLHYKVPQEELRGWFFMTSGNEVPLRVAKGYSDLKIDEPLIQCIAGEVGRNEIDVAILDPLVTLHGVSEQDNNKMDQVVRIFAGIANAQDCALELAHHTRKLAAGATDYTADDMRGASSTRDAVRAARMLNQMTQKDAEDVGIPEHARTSYFRVDRVKGNNAPPSKAVWRRFVNVELPNSDEVGVVEPWAFPGQDTPSAMMSAANQTAESVFMRLLVRLTLEGRTISDRTGVNFAPFVFAQEPEAKEANLGKRPLADAMRRLFRAKRIRVNRRGEGGHRVHCLVVV